MLRAHGVELRDVATPSTSLGGYGDIRSRVVKGRA